MIWVRYGWREKWDPAWHGASTKHFAELWSSLQALWVYVPPATMLLYIVSSC